MFRLPGAGASPDKAAIEEEKRRNRKNVWFTMKAFVAYVALLRLAPYVYKALNG
ncbi:Mitochondrial import receptor subunit TOM5 [Porites harrisoni]